MTRTSHRLLLTFYTVICVATLTILGYVGYSFYVLPVEERFFHEWYELLKPSGIIGHGLGIIGTLFIIIGLFSYQARKYIKALSRVGTLKYWLDFHIFMCTLGPILILYHTSFKFGGIVSVSFWSMVAVWASGVIGRFIYLQIPRSIEGRELSLQEAHDMNDELVLQLKNRYQIEVTDANLNNANELKQFLKKQNIPSEEYKRVIRLIKDQNRLDKRIKRLAQMQSYFKYWHVAHLPFAIIMLVIMVIHVGVTLFFGYKWIF